MVAFRDSKILGIIPARGGSKSISKKNIRLFCGKPLVAWKIEAARASGVFDRIICSTDDAEIAEVAKRFGAEVPFMRPAELAQDATPTLPVLQHAVSHMREAEGYTPDIIVTLEPTTPALQPFHIREAIDLFVSSGADSVMGMVEVPTAFSPYWQFTMDDVGRLSLFTGVPTRNVIRHRQNLPKTYHRNSTIYVFKPELLFAAEPSIYGGDARAYIMERKYSGDLDTPEDWIEAEKEMLRLIAGDKAVPSF